MTIAARYDGLGMAPGENAAAVEMKTLTDVSFRPVAPIRT